MKRLMICFVLLSMSFVLLMGQSAFNAQFIPTSVQVNVLNTSSFDPVNPHLQPILTTLQLRNNSAAAAKFDMKLEMLWNSISLASATFRSRQALNSGAMQTLTNRDFITNNETSPILESLTNNLNLDSVLKNPYLENAILAGFFPDGNLRFKVSVGNEGSATTQNWGSVAEFVIQIRNTAAIHLVFPGKPIGQTPSAVNVLPATFMWNSTITGFNEFSLTIREFAPLSPPTAGNVNNSGVLFYQSEVGNVNTFSDFLSFQEDHFYAWRVSTNIYNEGRPVGQPGGGNSLFSNWFVFKYVTDSTQDTSMEITAILNFLNNPLLQNLFSHGFSPTGNVIYEGRVYSGQEALDLINSLIGKDVTIEIGN